MWELYLYEQDNIDEKIYSYVYEKHLAPDTELPLISFLAVISFSTFRVSSP